MNSPLQRVTVLTLAILTLGGCGHTETKLAEGTSTGDDPSVVAPDQVDGESTPAERPPTTAAGRSDDGPDQSDAGSELPTVEPESQGPGIAVGEAAPGFRLSDQTGREVALEDLLAKGGVAAVFYRSADW